MDYFSHFQVYNLPYTLNCICVSLFTTIVSTVRAVSIGQHKKTRQHHNSTSKPTFRCKIMLFYVFKMVVSIASLCVNASDRSAVHFLHTAGSDPIFQIYMDAPPGVPGASKNQNFII